jgi:hypothetical protein
MLEKASWIFLKLIFSDLWITLLKELKDKSLTRRIYLQNTHLRKDMYPKRINNS